MNTVPKIPAKGVWSENSANQWEFSMLSGNGELGAMLQSDINSDKLIVTHEDLFLPLGNNETLPDIGKYIPEVRKIIAENEYLKALQFLSEKGLEQGHKFIPTDPFHPGVILNFSCYNYTNSENKSRDFKRIQNFETGEIATVLNENLVRKLFVSRDKKACIMRIYNTETKIDFKLSLEHCENALINSKEEYCGEFITVHNEYIHAKSGYDTCIKLIANDGEIKFENEEVIIKNTSYVDVFIKIEFLKDIENSNIDKMKNDINKITEDYDLLLENHAKIHSELFNRTELNLFDDINKDKSYEELIKISKENKICKALYEKIYQASKYMLICSCGKMPPNLHGIWTGTWNPMWSGDFTINTNVQLAIEGLLSAGYHDLLKSYFNLVETYVEDYKENAKKLFNCKGLLSPSRISNTGKSLHWGVGNSFPSIFWTCGMGWLLHWYYDYFTYTGDKKFLKERALPLMKGTAEFYEDFLIYDESGKLRFTPSFSAENALPNFDLQDNSTQDIAVARELLTNLITACEILDENDERIPTWKKLLEDLPPYLINEDGVLQEWAVIGAKEYPNHRHYSQMYSIFESLEFDKDENLELWNASRKALELKLTHWLRNPNAQDPASHGKAHLALCAVRFGEGDIVEEIYEMMVKNNTYYPSLITSNFAEHKIFNVDMNGGTLRIINDGIAYARKDKIILLSAMPNFESGECKNIKLNGQITLKNIKWSDNGKKFEAVLHSDTEKTVKVSYPTGETNITFKGCIKIES